MADKWFASSKLCNVCGYKNNNLTLSVRNWDCPICNTNHDRDINASINLTKYGIEKIIGETIPKFTLVEKEVILSMKQEVKLLV